MIPWLTSWEPQTNVQPHLKAPAPLRVGGFFVRAKDHAARARRRILDSRRDAPHARQRVRRGRHAPVIASTTSPDTRHAPWSDAPPSYVPDTLVGSQVLLSACTPLLHRGEPPTTTPGRSSLTAAPEAAAYASAWHDPYPRFGGREIERLAKQDHQRKDPETRFAFRGLFRAGDGI